MKHKESCLIYMACTCDLSGQLNYLKDLHRELRNELETLEEAVSENEFENDCE